MKSGRLWRNIRESLMVAKIRHARTSAAATRNNVKICDSLSDSKH